MTCGTIFLMWLGEQIDEYGIGNGISLLIMAGILAQMPGAAVDLWQNAERRLTGFGSGRLASRRSSCWPACSWRSCSASCSSRWDSAEFRRKAPSMCEGVVSTAEQRQYLPLRINQAGVMPIIFASSLLMFPQIIFGWLANLEAREFGEFMTMSTNAFRSGSFLYNLMYVAMIYFFCYFWTAITFNPKDMADNLKNYGTFIPGYRPGKRTADYLERVMVRITYVGAGFLALVAIIPTMISSSLGVSFTVASFYGGTGSADRRQRGVRSGAEDRQPLGDAKLSGPARVVVGVVGRVHGSLTVSCHCAPTP